MSSEEIPVEIWMDLTDEEATLFSELILICDNWIEALQLAKRWARQGQTLEEVREGVIRERRRRDPDHYKYYGNDIDEPDEG